ncbi:MAG: hypothetical protein JO131_06375, partial [Gammaproteobacteria bacterium]|nr:hypothetical protein [Gammaproteobacteria bacterium]
MRLKTIKMFANIHLDDELPKFTLAKKENELKVPEKPRFFANVHLDSDLLGSNLEGGNIQKTAAFLLKMLEDFSKEEEIKCPLELKQALKELQESPLALSEAEVKHLELQYKNPHLKNIYGETKFFAPKDMPKETRDCVVNCFEELVNYTHLAKKIMALPEGESLTIPGGYAGVAGENGHAVIYRFKKQNENIFIEVFNTGSGAERHFDAEENVPPDYFQTEACYQLKDEGMLERILTSMGLITFIPTLPKATDETGLQQAFSCDM